MRVNNESFDFNSNDNILCPKCSCPLNNRKNINKNLINNIIKEFIKLNCDKCNINFCYILCIYCNKKIYMKMHPKNIKYNSLNGLNISCPYKSCEKVFYFTECIRCKRVQKLKHI